MPHLSKSKAAARAGMSRPGLEKHIKAGRVRVQPDGNIDVASFEAWLQARSPISATMQPLLQPEGGADGAAAENARAAFALLDQEGVFPTQADAQRFRDSFIGRLRQVEYDREAARVADVGDTAQVVGEQLAKVRTLMLAIPAERAPQIFRCKTVAEVQDLLRDIITRALEELTFDGKGAS